MNKLLSPVLNNQLFDNLGKMLSGGQIYVYDAGTLTLSSVYANEGGGALANPISLNSVGRIANGQLFLDPGKLYDMEVKQGTTVLESFTNISGLLGSDSGFLGSITSDSFVGDGLTKTFTLSLTPEDSSLVSVFIDGLYLVSGTDYVLSGNQIVFVSAPASGEQIIVKTQRSIASDLPASYQRNKIVDKFTTSSGTLSYNLSKSPGSISNIIAVLNGITLVPGTDYSWNALNPTTFTLVNNPLVSDLIVFYHDILPVLNNSSDVITYSTTGQYLTTYLDNNKIANVKDFGAVGDGVADDTLAIQNAINSGNIVYCPPGTYKCTSTLNLANLSSWIGSGYNGGASTGSVCVFYNLSSNMPALLMPIAKKNVFSLIQDMTFKASSWDVVTGANGHGLDCVGQLSMDRVQFIGFKRIGIYAHHDASLSGPYESIWTNVRSLYSGQHGITVGRGANSMTIINAECKWNGAPSYLTAPTTIGTYDGLYVDNYDDGSGYPSYLPEGLTVIGGDASYNARYGFNIQGVSYGRIMPGYAEFNKATYDANLGIDLQNSFVQFGRTPITKVNLAATYGPYQRTNSVFIGGKFFGSGNTNSAPQNNFLLTNLSSSFSEDSTTTKTVSMIPNPTTGDATLGAYGGAVLTIGSGASVALPLNANVQFSGVNTTGAGSALLGSNCPATTLTSPYKWIRVLASDGTVCFLPIWK